MDRDLSGKLRAAVMNGDIKAVLRLIKGGTDVNHMFSQKNWVSIQDIPIIAHTCEKYSN